MLLLGVVGLLVLVLAGIGIFAAPAPDEKAPADPPTGPQPGHRWDQRAVESWQDLPALPTTDNPVVYARALATAVGEWDTLSGLSPSDYMSRIMVEADPTGVEAAALRDDLARYLPDEDTWRRLQQMHTRQTLGIHGAWVPERWDQIARAYTGQLQPGTVAVVVQADRHRAGVWHGQLETSRHEFTFTALLRCDNRAERCYPLRLSAIGAVLE